MSHPNRLYYVIYDDDLGNEATTLVYAPTEHLVRVLMRPYDVHDVILVNHPDFELELIAESDHFPWREES
jgi:hypothetical protein